MEEVLTDELINKIADKYIRIQSMTFEQFLNLELSNKWHLLEGRVIDNGEKKS